ncbi:MAG: hypothetical protein CMJ19_06870 [Phycisphaeraceae bacterium]|nr:hypothetical protein [Phycisphaeraceae bacterium]
MRIALTLIVCLSVICTGCTTTGKDYDETKTHEIVVGQTTEAQLVEWFGQPESRSRSSTGDTTLMWSYHKMKFKAGMFVPILGPFIGGSNHEGKNLSVVTDTDGVVKSYSDSSNNFEQNH